MKKIIVFSLVSSFFFTSCLTLQGVKKPLILVDLPPNTTVTCNGEPLEIKQLTAMKEEHTTGNPNNKTTYVTLYKHDGVRLKIKRNTVLEFKSGDKVGRIKIKPRVAIGMLVYETIGTVGIGTIVDLSTGAYRVPKYKFIDVPAALNNTTQREQRDLFSVIRVAHGLPPLKAKKKNTPKS